MLHAKVETETREDGGGTTLRMVRPLAPVPLPACFRVAVALFQTSTAQRKHSAGFGLGSQTPWPRS